MKKDFLRIGALFLAALALGLGLTLLTSQEALACTPCNLSINCSQAVESCPNVPGGTNCFNVFDGRCGSTTCCGDFLFCHCLD